MYFMMPVSYFDSTNPVCVHLDNRMLREIVVQCRTRIFYAVSFPVVSTVAAYCVMLSKCLYPCINLDM